MSELTPRSPRSRTDAAVLLLGLAAVVALARYRRWHLRWGATDAEVAAPMPGDDLVPRAPFRATRAITIEAPPAVVWPWIVQMGFGRAGFYSYDVLDNLGRRSAPRILPEYQDPAVGDLAAPMASPPNDRNSFRVFGLEPRRWLGWHKPGSTWVWVLTARDGGAGTRLVVRLQESYALPWAAFTAPLMEVADFPMMRKQLLEIRARAEQRHRPGPREVLRTPGTMSTAEPKGRNPAARKARSD